MSSKIDNTIDLTQENFNEFIDDDTTLIQEYLSSSGNIKYVKDNEKLYDITNELLSWYHLNRRKLPWRGDSDESTPRTIKTSAYGTWVSELMLQQTRVETVIPYWIRWMNKYPKVESLAKATSEEVNTMWAGLGYYRRAQSLLQAAKVIVNEYDSIIPDNVDDLLKLPGIGAYTAGAIASIAYNKSEAIVDGNVNRVLSRVFCIGYTLGTKEMNKSIWQISRDLVDTTTFPSEFNQALMELGAVVCKPTQPNCLSCPIRNRCRTYQLVQYKKKLLEIDKMNSMIENLPDDVSIYPKKAMKSNVKDILITITIYINKISNETLMIRRSEKGLLANQWEFPTVLHDNTDFIHDWISSDKNKSDFSVLFNDFNQKFNKIYDFNSKHKLIDNLILLSDCPIKHIFSHQIHYMFISLQYIEDISNKIDLTNNSFNTNENSITELDNESDQSEKIKRDYKWVNLFDIDGNSLTSGCKKVLKHVLNHLQLSNPLISSVPKKRKLTKS